MIDWGRQEQRPVYNGVKLLHGNEGLDAGTAIHPEKEHAGGALWVGWGGTRQSKLPFQQVQCVGCPEVQGQVLKRKGLPVRPPSALHISVCGVDGQQGRGQRG